MKSLLGNGEQIKVYFFEKLLMERGELLFLSSLLAFSHPYLWEEKIFGDICSIWCFLLWDGLEQCGLSGTHRNHCIFPVLWIVGGAKQMTTNKKRLNEICELLGARAARARGNRRKLIVLLLIYLKLDSFCMSFNEPEQQKEGLLWRLHWPFLLLSST